jgi:nitrogen fixation NifU-like protein
MNDGNGAADWADELQTQLDRDLKLTYSPRVLELWQHPRNAGALHPADGYASLTGPCGDTMEIWLRVVNDTITEATFWTDGCGSSIVCGSMVTILAKGKTADDASAIDQQAVLVALGGLPEGERHCALLAASTLAAAIRTLARRTL